MAREQQTISESKPKAQVYTAPNLVHYGTLRTRTQSGSGVSHEGDEHGNPDISKRHP